MHRHQILIVDDEPDIRNSLRTLLCCENCNIQTAGSVREALEIIDTMTDEEHIINIIDAVLDPVEGDHGGINLAVELTIRKTHCTNILITGSVDDYVARYIQKLDEQKIHDPSAGLFVAYLMKPFSGNQLRDAVRKCIHSVM